MAIFIVIAIMAAACTSVVGKTTMNYKLDRQYASQGLDSPRYRLKLAKLAAAGLPPSGAEVARPGAKGYFSALWNDAWDDLTENHTKVRAAKKAGERPTMPQRVGAAWRWAKNPRPAGESGRLREALAGLRGWAKTPIAQRQAEDLDRARLDPKPDPEPAAAPPEPGGDRAVCPDCGAAVIRLWPDMEWGHANRSPCPVAKSTPDPTPPPKAEESRPRPPTYPPDYAPPPPPPYVPRPSKKATPESTETNPKENTMGENTATGDVHDVESCRAELDALTEDLSKVDAALDAIDEAIRHAAEATEKIEAWMASKDLDDATVSGMRQTLDGLNADRIKTLMDAVETARLGVQDSIDGLAPLEEANELIGAAAGSALNNR